MNITPEYVVNTCDTHYVIRKCFNDLIRINLRTIPRGDNKSDYVLSEFYKSELILNVFNDEYTALRSVDFGNDYEMLVTLCGKIAHEYNGYGWTFLDTSIHMYRFGCKMCRFERKL